ncbi:ATP-binding protein [Candidatus Magnetobacterium casense]|uniref:ATP-binding protein n=1 Tax=Candidatus Magnetobacterium casense TaxID=1455061 RepID=UPI0005904D9D|nr:ATP-binding protein [Candidatus Magnetobacterium casensis]
MNAKQSIRQKLMKISMLAVCIALLLAGTLLIATEIIVFRQSLIERIGVMVETIGTNTTASLTFNDPKTAEETLYSLKSAPHVTCAVLYNRDDKVLALYNRDVSGMDCSHHQIRQYDYHMGLNHLDVFHRIMLDNEIVGTLYMKSDIREIYHRIKWYVVTILIVTMLSIATAFLIMSRLQKIITKPLSEMTHVMLAISESKDYSARVDIQNQDEFGLLGEKFNEMLLQIQKRDADLALHRENLEQTIATRTSQLYKTLDELKQSQKHLIQSEKMASLGQLVAGVAHEINTPVGIAITLSSAIVKTTGDIMAAFNNKSLNKLQLEQYINEVGEGSSGILTNLLRSADLIKRFKMVSTDQLTQDRRKFKIKKYLEEILMTLKPKLKDYPHTIEIKCPEDVEMDSYPGALAQIITNLLLNSLIHAYEPDDKGNITIEVIDKEREIVVEYIDDGKGMSAENLKRVFEPFFTTRRGSGGTGLGLHIVYNIVTQTFGGRIECNSIEGEGTRFIITFPVSELERA